METERKIRYLELAAKCWEMVLLYEELLRKEPDVKMLDRKKWFETEAKKYQQWANNL